MAVDKTRILSPWLDLSPESFSVGGGEGVGPALGSVFRMKMSVLEWAPDKAECCPSWAVEGTGPT